MYQIHSTSLSTVGLTDLLQLTKPKIVVLLAITGAVAFCMPVTGSISIPHLILYILLGYFVAGGAMVVNNAIDYDIDAMMERTQSRVSTGQLSRIQVTVFGSILMVLGLVPAFIIFGGYTTLFLAWGGFFYIFGYSLLLKRNTILNTIFGGLASPAPVWGGYAARYELIGQIPKDAILGVPIEGWLIGLLVFLWTPTHTWAMAVKNYHDYENASIPMLPVVLGIRKTAYICLLGGIIILVFASYLVLSIHPQVLLFLLLINSAFLLSLLKFALRPTIAEGTQNFYAHNIWLGMVFLLLL